MDKSKPNFMGLKKYAVPQVLSIAVIMFLLFAKETIFPKSWNSNELLPGFSIYISLVLLVDVKKRLRHWVIPFLGILFQEWRHYDVEGIHIPDAVKDKTSSYRNENDIIGQWIQDQCEEVEHELSADGITETAPGELKYLYAEFNLCKF